MAVQELLNRLEKKAPNWWNYVPWFGDVVDTARTNLQALGYAGQQAPSGSTINRVISSVPSTTRQPLMSQELPGVTNYTTNDSSTALQDFISGDSGYYGDIPTAKTQAEMDAIFAEQERAANAYVDDLISMAEGDSDLVIRQINREHQLSLGTDDKARAEFMETVADKLEERIGTIPYDYKVGTERIGEDLARAEFVTERNKSRVLSRLAEDEQVWKRDFGEEAEEARGLQQEDLLKRGILSGTREGAEGLAGKEVGDLETDITRQLQAYDRALGRGREDIETESADTLFSVRREAKRGLEDLKTESRRGAIAAEDRQKFGTEAERRRLEARKKELERLRRKELDVAQREALV